ncbi:GPW/gp25 family protein [Glaciimonas sp. Gout2]|uniref:GPW/gp25 family protein n=1 Tax=unclassified Glaciimonas TaxID=2644401 RepID=UPI002B239B1F|nr:MULTISPECIES: GPW/gp25 family protein [unclassified Glaciimonas]MEB0012573.1 GPW/gp25 family protein [Glaciimonas sp. Cout2]MEB0083924.1 GPW/gp25 family protein [Glaciimonas sp. Gout2]
MSGMHRSTGRALTGLAHIRQSLADILTTPIGSRVMRRGYGSEVPDLIDQPLHGATTLRIYAATAHAVRLWEPRINLTGLQLQRDADGKATLLLDGVAAEQSVQLTVPVSQGGV